MLFFESKLRQVYLTKLPCTWSRVLSEVTISTGYDALLFARSFSLHANNYRFAAFLSGIGLPCLLVIQGSLESRWYSARAIFVTHKHKLTNLAHISNIHN